MAEFIYQLKYDGREVYFTDPHKLQTYLTSMKVRSPAIVRYADGGAPPAPAVGRVIDGHVHFPTKGFR